MPIPIATLLPLVARLSRDHAGDTRLAAIAARARVRSSPFEIHRGLRRLMGEPPKQFAQRLRVERAAAELVTGRRPILEIAIANGFAGHEVFARAFLRRFGMSPRSYRARGLAGGARALRRHAAIVRDVGPCVALYQLSTSPMPTTTTTPSTMSNIAITRRIIEPLHALVIRRTIARAQIAATIAEQLPRVFAHAQAIGVAFAGPPFARYPRMGLGTLDIEVGMPVAARAAGAGEIAAIELYAGPVAFAVHRGPYERLAESHEAVERWIAANALARAGAPWEVYVTDPGQVPDPADWRTEIWHPLAG